MAATEGETSSGQSDSQYFNSYQDLDVHALMLKDQRRTQAYRDYMEKNSDMIRGKVVLDVGAGTGILSLFAARAGAKHVYAVEASEMAKVCSAIVEANNFSEQITVIQSTIEALDALPGGQKADVLVSEWMGFYLLHESMLNSIIEARDKFLSSDGLMLPTSASLYLCPVSMSDFHRDQIEHWGNFHGFDFGPFGSLTSNKLQTEPQIVTLDPKQCLSPAELITRLDLMYVAQEDIIDITSSQDFFMAKNGLLHGFACWFEVEFEGSNTATFDTGPHSGPTHWKQTVVLLPETLMVNRQQKITCELNLKQDGQHPRRYNITIAVPEEEEEEDDDEESDEPCVDEFDGSRWILAALQEQKAT